MGGVSAGLTHGCMLLLASRIWIKGMKQSHEIGAPIMQASTTGLPLLLVHSSAATAMHTQMQLLNAMQGQDEGIVYNLPCPMPAHALWDEDQPATMPHGHGLQ